MTELVGTWRLASLRRTTSDGRVVDLPLGERPTGLLVYTPDGHVSVHMAAAGRSPLSTPDPRLAGDAERDRAYTEYIGYCGRFVVRGDTVVHEVETASNPNHAGIEKLRSVSLSGDELTLRTPLIESHHGPVVLEVRWTRVGRRT